MLTGFESKHGVESLNNFRFESEAVVGADSAAVLRNRLCIQLPCRFVVAGAFGKVYKMFAAHRQSQPKT